MCVFDELILQQRLFTDISFFLSVFLSETYGVTKYGRAWVTGGGGGEGGGTGSVDVECGSAMDLHVSRFHLCGDDSAPVPELASPV